MKATHLLGLAVMALALGSSCSDPSIQVDRDLFRQNGEKWCAKVQQWKYVRFDPSNCGDCGELCRSDYNCVDGVCSPSSVDPDIGTVTPNYCLQYAQCADVGCARNPGCKTAADCLPIEQACATQRTQTLEEMRAAGSLPLECDVVHGSCGLTKPEPPDDTEGPPPSTPPPVHNADNCCGDECSNCTTTGQECEGDSTSGYACVCTGCMDNGTCYPMGTRRDFPEREGYTCGASCKCLSTSEWGACTPLDFC